MEGKKKKIKNTDLQEHIMGDLALIGGLISHELNNAIGIVEMAALNLKTMQSRDMLNEEQVHKIVKLLEQSQTRVRHISSNLKTYAHPREQFSEKKHIPFRAFILDLFDKIQSEKQTKQEVIIDIKDDEVVLENPLFLERVFFHLLENSIMANQRNGSSKIWVELSGEEGSQCFRVFDEGGGIREDQHFYVTKPFYQLEESLEHHGVGLSLVEYVCKHNQVKFNIKNSDRGLEVILKQSSED